MKGNFEVNVDVVNLEVRRDVVDLVGVGIVQIMNFQEKLAIDIEVVEAVDYILNIKEEIPIERKEGKQKLRKRKRSSTTSTRVVAL